MGVVKGDGEGIFSGETGTGRFSSPRLDEQRKMCVEIESLRRTSPFVQFPAFSGMSKSICVVCPSC